MKMTATPCIIAVPSILIVAPSGMVKDAIFLETPILRQSVSMLSGTTAALIDVVKANVMTGKNFLINRKGLSLANVANSVG